jgi:hypothetical protein
MLVLIVIVFFLQGEFMPTIFVSMPFSDNFNRVFSIISESAKKLGLTTLRIDQKTGATSIVDEIQQELRNSKIVVADITGNNPNVLNEIGRAQMLDKPLILLSQDNPTDAPFNIRGLRIYKYDLNTFHALANYLEKSLLDATSPSEALRSMIVPSSLGRPTPESKFIIAASPLSYRRAIGRGGGYKKLRNTASDYVGVRGIFQAFGILYGFQALPEMVDPEDCDDAVIRESMNLYCIASPKANRWTNTILREYQLNWVPKIEFRADPFSKDLRNVKTSLHKDDNILQPSGWQAGSQGDRYYRDYGIILRGPNPFHDGYMATIIAGRSSLGTEAAATAFTSPKYVDKIQHRLAGLDIDIEDHRKPFLALVKMERSIGDEREEGNINTLDISDVFSFHRIN